MPLITSNVTLTGQSHFMLIFVLRKVTFSKLHQLCTMNYVAWSLVTPAAYHELTQLVPENPPVKLNESDVMVSPICVNSWYGAGVTTLIRGTELRRFGTWLV
jgi:hypothetical protein